MLLKIHTETKQALHETIARLWSIPPPDIVLNQTPKVELGELATPVCFELARQLKRSPKAIAEELTNALPAIPGVKRAMVAGAGYINLFLDRAGVFTRTVKEFEAERFEAFPPATDKFIVEHTNINPNKAAHIGHLRNAAIGDTFVRVLRACGKKVEVQNYIDNTGVQVADVIVGFQHVERKSLDQVRALIHDANVRFDFHCWDLYAAVSSFYEANDPKHSLRGETLKAIEHGGNPTAELAELVATAIVRCHIATMARLGVQYDLLPRESDILHLKFWDRAFELLKERDAIFFQTEGKNSGCWVMRIESEGYDDDKIIVRSNGTVTYVGKDIAYQLWKLGLLPRNFHYKQFHTYADGHQTWVTTSEAGESEHPDFGKAASVYNVIDVRQSYLQHVVKQGVLALGYQEEAKHSIHFSYEMVALSPACAEQLGIVLTEEDRKRPHVEVSGRKGQGVKADDLLDQLEASARAEVVERNPDLSAPEVEEISRQIAVGALRFFLLRFTRNAVIAFDFKEALSFDGETGPYLQYATVRSRNILAKVRDVQPHLTPTVLEEFARSPKFTEFLDGADDIWDMVYTAARLDELCSQVWVTMEPAALAKHGFALAQRFNLFYHRYRIISEEDAERRMFYMNVVAFVGQALTRILSLLGIATPQRM